jgi:hypothetical protein
VPEIVKGTLVRRQTVWAALLGKEWSEQRWRFFLGTIVVSGLLAGLLRAQIVSSLEAAVLIYGPVGLILVIFFAAGPVSSERADRTWEFLVVQPVSRSDVILAKWAVGVLQLTGIMTISTVAGLLAMWSRGFRIMPAISGLYFETHNSLNEVFTAWTTTHPALSLCTFAMVGTIALACWFTPLFLILTRARNEFAAALGGAFLTIAVLLWLTQFIMLLVRISDGALETTLLRVVMTILNPLSPFPVVIESEYASWLPQLLIADVIIWVVFPLWYVARSSSRLVEKWVGV